MSKIVDDILAKENQKLKADKAELLEAIKDSMSWFKQLKELKLLHGYKRLEKFEQLIQKHDNNGNNKSKN